MTKFKELFINPTNVNAISETDNNVNENREGNRNPETTNPNAEMAVVAVALPKIQKSEGTPTTSRSVLMKEKEHNADTKGIGQNLDTNDQSLILSVFW